MIIDTHVHYYDPTREGGAPWPDPKDTVIYLPTYPDRCEALAEPCGVTGTIMVECSEWVVQAVRNDGPALHNPSRQVLPVTRSAKRVVSRRAGIPDAERVGMAVRASGAVKTEGPERLQSCRPSSQFREKRILKDTDHAAGRPMALEMRGTPGATWRRMIPIGPVPKPEIVGRLFGNGQGVRARIERTNIVLQMRRPGTEDELADGNNVLQTRSNEGDRFRSYTGRGRWFRG